MDTGRISTNAVGKACFVPEKPEPAVNTADSVMLATLIWEECDAVGVNPADFRTVNTTEIENLFRHHYVAILVAFGLADRQLPGFQVNIFHF